jgi:hypothetical protein
MGVSIIPPLIVTKRTKSLEGSTKISTTLSCRDIEEFIYMMPRRNVERQVMMK